MTATHKNFLKTTISAVASAGLGAFTISTASSGHRTFGAGDDGLTFDNITIREGTDWEVCDGCVYTHSGTSLSRGTRQDSSTGGAIAFTSAAVVSQGGTADWARRMESAGLNSVTSSADANITMTVGTLHCVDISGYTADRTATLPAVAAVDDRCGVYITTGDDAYELLCTATGGDTLNGIAGGTEWSRVFITNELLIFRCIVANTTWVVEYDGRIPQVGNMRLSTSADGESANTFTRPTQASSAGAWTADVDIGGICSTSGDQIKTRRAGRFNLFYVGLIKDLLADQKLHGAALFFNGTANILHAATMYSSGLQAQSSTGVILGYSMAADDYVVYQYRTQDGSLGLSATSLPRIGAGFGLLEVLS